MTVLSLIIHYDSKLLSLRQSKLLEGEEAHSGLNSIGIVRQQICRQENSERKLTEPGLKTGRF